MTISKFLKTLRENPTKTPKLLLPNVLDYLHRVTFVADDSRTLCDIWNHFRRDTAFDTAGRKIVTFVTLLIFVHLQLLLAEFKKMFCDVKLWSGLRRTLTSSLSSFSDVPMSYKNLKNCRLRTSSPPSRSPSWTSSSSGVLWKLKICRPRTSSSPSFS